MKKYNCAICKKELEREDKHHFTAHDQTIVCLNHREYAFFANMEVAQKHAGVISEYSEKMKYCEVCESQIEQDIIDQYDSWTNHPVCKKHIYWMSVQQTPIGVMCMYYLREFPDEKIHSENKDDMKKVLNWFDKSIHSKQFQEVYEKNKITREQVDKFPIPSRTTRKHIK